MTKDNNNLGKFQLEGIPPMPRGVPQVEVTFDIDANCILNVSATEKSTGKKQSITITNDGSRLSKEEVEKSLQEAEKYRAEDEAFLIKVNAKNELENYVYQMKATLSDEKMAGKMEESDKTMISEKLDSTLQWIGANNDAEKEEFDEKKSELEKLIMPILQNMMGGDMPEGMPPMGTGMGMPGEMPTNEMPDEGPKIEEID